MMQYLQNASIHRLLRLGRSTFSLLCAFMLSGLSHAQTTFGDTLCLGVKFAQGQPLTELPTLQELGVRWVRDVVFWGQVELSPGKFNDELPAAVQRRLQYYREHQIGVIMILGLGNSRAYPDTGANPLASISPDRFSDYALYMARKLQESGVQFALEVWNEPHNTLSQKVGGHWAGAHPSPWVDHYVRMVNLTVQKVRQFDSTINIFSQDDMWVPHYWFMEAGLTPAITGFTVHPYNGAAKGPEITAVGYETDWTRPFHVVDPDRSFRSAVKRLQAQGLKKLRHNTPIWITEWGWPVGGDWNGQKLTPEDVAMMLPRAFIVAAAAGVDKTCWFSAQDSVDGPMGLSDNQLQRRPAYQAMRTLSQQLGTFGLPEHVMGAQHVTSGVQGFLFRDGQRAKLVIWNIDGPSKQLRLTPVQQAELSEITDYLGRQIEVGGKATLEFGYQPLYLTFKTPSAAHTLIANMSIEPSPASR
ncbi:MAG: cellulase family glycosylhydrolase [Aquabacterium sp.]|uniref:cellulase family glycosylhydrolase n=1 Tax=Aquabacterium sp. TaxID=1872578 RepID=UPI003BEAB517